MGELANPYLKESVTNFLLVCLSTDLALAVSWQVQEHCEGVGQLRGALQFCVVLELAGHGGLLRCEEEKK